jgi:hypothetical protein
MNGFFVDNDGTYMVRDMVHMCRDRIAVILPLRVLVHNMGFECWWDDDGKDVTPHQVLRNDDATKYASHKQRIEDADLSYPIIVSSDNYDVMDGMHRLAKSIRNGAVGVQCYLVTRRELRSIRM